MLSVSHVRPPVSLPISLSSSPSFPLGLSQATLLYYKTFCPIASTQTHNVFRSSCATRVRHSFWLFLSHIVLLGDCTTVNIYCNLNHENHDCRWSVIEFSVYPRACIHQVVAVRTYNPLGTLQTYPLNLFNIYHKGRIQFY